MKKYNHVMIDIETLGTKPYCAILSIGAVEFDMHSGKTGKEFYMKIDPKSCLNRGLQIDIDTVMWWMAQSDAARNEFRNKKESFSIERVLNEFTKYFKGMDKDVQVWANPPGFDCNHIEEAYTKVLNSHAPWSHRQSRCYRTILKMVPAAETPSVETGTAHKAIDDCFYQISRLRYAVKALGLTGYIK